MKHLKLTGILLAMSLAFWTLGCPPEDDDPEVVTSYDVEMAGENQVPAVATPASGTMEVTLDENDVLTIEGSFENLVSRLVSIEGSPAHVHVGRAGENGPIAFNVNVDADDDQRSGTFRVTRTLDADELETFENNEFYLNIHTQAYPGGELRAQLDSDAPEFAGADESWGIELATQPHPHSIDTDAEGWVWALLRNDDSFVVSGAAHDLTSTVTAVTIERAAIGETGDVVFDLEFEERDNGENAVRFWMQRDLRDTEIDSLRDGDYYLNIITEEYPEGELRGQFDDDTGFFEDLWEDIFGDDPDRIDEAPPF